MRAVCPVCHEPDILFRRAEYLVCQTCFGFRTVRGSSVRTGGEVPCSPLPFLPADSSGGNPHSAKERGGPSPFLMNEAGSRHPAPGPLYDPLLVTHLEAGGKKVGPFDGDC